MSALDDRVTMDFLASEAELARALGSLAAEDTVSLPLVGEELRARLLEEAAGLAYRPAKPTIGEGERLVRQEFELTMTFAPESPFRRFAEQLEARLVSAMRRLDPPPMAEAFHLNDLIVQRYLPGSVGITPHRDHVRYRGLVALIILAGEARFHVCSDRSGAEAREIPSPPGSLLLMRGPGFAGLQDRPFHFVEGITSERYSFGLRHDTRPD